MYQPEGYDGRVCKLKKALYGLKQAPLQWNKKFSSAMQLGLKPCSSDPCVYVREADNLYFALYVDDGLCLAPSLHIIDSFLDSLEKSFKLTRSAASCYVGIEIQRDRERRTLKLHHTAHLKRVLERFSMKDCNPVGHHTTLVKFSRRTSTATENRWRLRRSRFAKLLGHPCIPPPVQGPTLPTRLINFRAS